MPCTRLPRLLLAALLAAASSSACAQEPSSGATLRVESEIFVDGGAAAAARSFTLFTGDVAWNFLEMAGEDKEEPTTRLVEIALHDPARERVVVIDPRRGVKTQIDTVRLERLSVSLAKWARHADDRLIRWAGGPDFGDGLSERDGMLELVGPRVRYTVAFEPAPTGEAAAAYRRFADTAILLKALLQPGGIPPFPRLALNRRIEAAGGIPRDVTLEVDPRMAVVTGRPGRLRCVHKTHPRLLGSDLARIEHAEASVAAATAVDLAAYMETAPPADGGEAEGRRSGRDGS